VGKLTLAQVSMYLTNEDGAMDSGRLVEAQMRFARAAAKAKAEDMRAKRGGKRG
jgi:hypothetical protein